MHLRRIAILAALGFSVLAGHAQAQAQVAPPIAVRDTADLGPILTDQVGRTLYLYTQDAPGASTCYDQCAIAWPPLTVADAESLTTDLPGIVGTTPRADGTTQITYNSMPLYYWIADQQPGDMTGQSIDGVWFVVAP